MVSCNELNPFILGHVTLKCAVKINQLENIINIKKG